MFNQLFNAANAALAAAAAQQTGFVSPAMGPFKKNFSIYPVVMANKAHLECGDKILLPPSALDHLARLHVTYPMMFSIRNKRSQKRMHCGVLEFSGEEGVAYVPYWMMENLLVESGDIVEIENVALEKGTFVKLKPHTTKFTLLYNPRVVLEQSLRNFSCLTKGDTIAIQHGEENYYLDIVEVKGQRGRDVQAISIVETDINVDFDEPRDYEKYKQENNIKPTANSTSSSSSSSSTNNNNNNNNESNGLLFKTQGDEKESKSSLSLPSSSAPSVGKADYFSKLRGGNKLVGQSTASSSLSANKPSSLSLSPTISPSTPHISPHIVPTIPTVREVVETQGQWNYIYSVDGKGTKKLVKRVRRTEGTGTGTGGGGASGVGGNNTFKQLQGKGHSLKG